MILKSKHSIGDTVWLITQGCRKEWESCPACHGTGRIVLADEKERSCPECYGRCGKNVFFEEQWEVGRQLTIGLVRAEARNIVSDGLFNNMGHCEPGNTTEAVEYMAYETGIGGGSVYYEKWLFASHDEAQAACDELNKAIKEVASGKQ